MAVCQNRVLLSWLRNKDKEKGLWMILKGTVQMSYLDGKASPTCGGRCITVLRIYIVEQDSFLARAKQGEQFEVRNISI